MKSKILTLLLVCASFLFAATSSSAQSNFTLVKQVTVEQLQTMNLNQMADLLPADSKTNLQKLIAIVDKTKLEAELRKSLIKHINETK